MKKVKGLAKTKQKIPHRHRQQDGDGEEGVEEGKGG